jgi:peptide/nickel transport system substrate-binding protein
VSEADYWHRRAGRTSRRRLLTVAVSGAAGVAASGLAGCSVRHSSTPTATTPAGAQDAPRPGGTLSVYVPFNAPLDPQKTSASPQIVVAGVYSRPFRFKTGLDPKVFPDHNIEPDLALSAESPDAITWTLKLRPDAKFANIPPVNGHAVEAEDVKAAFTRILDPATSSPNRAQLGMIDSTQIQTPDKTTVVFTLKYPYAPFNRTLASPAYSLILPREALAGSYDPSKIVIGSGPFTLDSYQPDVAYTYKKNPGWFAQGQPYVDAIHMAIVPDASQQLAQFTAGSLDEYLPTVADLESAKQRNPKAVVVDVANGKPNPVFWQMGDPASAFQDIRVRRALSMAIDRNALSKVIYNGKAVAPVFLPTYMGKWALAISDLPSDTQQFYKSNPAEAKKSLEAAGASNLELRFATVVNGGGGFASPDFQKEGQTISSMLSGIGLKMNIVTIDYNKDYIDSGKGISQGYYPKDMIVFGGFSGYTEADEWLFSNFHSKSVNSHNNVKDPTLDAMIDKERTLVDEEQRLKAVLEIQKYVADKMYFFPTVGADQSVLLQPRVRNYQYSSSLGSVTETYAKLWLSA